MADEYKFDPDALRKKLNLSEPAIEKAESELEKQPEVSHEDVYKGFASAKVENQNQPDSEKSNVLPIVGGIAGGMAQYKGAGTDIFKPDPTLFKANPVVAPEEAAPMSNVEHTMQSAQGQREGVTGRQRESSHNWESQRQGYANEQNANNPQAKKIIVEAGPMHATQSGVGIPKNVAVSLEEELHAKKAAELIEREKLLNAAKRRAAIVGAGRGITRIGQGIVGGAIAAPQLAEYASNAVNGKPTDNTQLVSGLGGLAMALGKGRAGLIGTAAQIPYAVKHREELLKNMTFNDINPTAMPLGTPGAQESPLSMPSR